MKKTIISTTLLASFLSADIKVGDTIVSEGNYGCSTPDQIKIVNNAVNKVNSETDRSSKIMESAKLKSIVEDFNCKQITYGMDLKVKKIMDSGLLLVELPNKDYLLTYFEDEEAKQIKMVSQNGYKIRDIENPSEAVQLAAIECYPSVIDEIKNPTDKVKIKALRLDVDSTFKPIKRMRPGPSEKVQEVMKEEWIKKHPTQIFAFKNPSEKLQLIAVNNKVEAYLNIASPTKKVTERAMELLKTEEKQLNAMKDSLGSIISIIKNPTEKVQLESVKFNGNNINFIKNPSAKVQIAAITNNIFAMQYIKNPTTEVKNYYNDFLNNEEKQLDMMLSTPQAIQLLKNPSENVQLQAIKYYDIDMYGTEEHPIKYMDNPSEKVQLIVVKQKSSLIEFIKDQTKEVQLLAVQDFPSNIRYIKNPTEEMQLIAVEDYAGSIDSIKEPTEKVQLIAIKNDLKYFKDIKNPTPKVIEYYNLHKND